MDIVIYDINIFRLFTYIITATLLAGILAFPIIGFLYRFKIVRHFDVDFSALIESRREKIGTPIMGGLIFIIPVIILNGLFNFTEFTDIPLLIFTATALLGGIDDILNIYGRARKLKRLSRIRKLIAVHNNPLIRLKYMVFYPWYMYARMVHLFESHPGKGLFGHEKLLVQTFLGILLGIWVLVSPIFPEHGLLWIPIFGTINIGILMIPFALIALLGMTNAVNFSDGMDGLSAGLLFSSFAGFLIIAILQNNAQIAILIGTILGALVTYLYFNVPPARVQMGDVGSFAMGAILTAIAFALEVPLLLPVIGLPFLVEMLSTVLQGVFRRFFGRRLFNMAPIHHHFEMLGWSEEKVVMRFWLFSISSALLGVWLYFL